MYRQGERGFFKMNTVHLTMDAQWIAHWSNGTETIFEDELPLRLEQLKAAILEQNVQGGTLSAEFFTEMNGQMIELSQYLTEETNRPFVIGTSDFSKKVAQIPWEVVPWLSSRQR